MTEPLNTPTEPTGDTEGADPRAMFESIYNRFVHLVLYARSGQGSWGPEDELASFMVFLRDPIVIQINGEPQGWTQPMSARTFSPSHAIEPTDLLSNPVSIDPAWGSGPSIGAKRHNDSWLLEFNFRGENPRARRLVAVADEFLDTARWDLDSDRLRAFTENAFHAAEALAKAELLTYAMTATEVEESRKHNGLLSTYHLWARLDNTDRRFPRLLQDLFELRRAATYGDAEFAPSDKQARQQLATLLDLRHHVDDVLAGRAGGVVNVIATRNLSAGQLVTVSDAAIRPHQSNACR